MTLPEAFALVSPTIERMKSPRTQLLLDLESLLRTPGLLAELHVRSEAVQKFTLDGNTVHLH